MRKRRFVRGVVIAAVVGWSASAGAWLATPTPQRVPVDGVKAAGVPRSYGAPRVGMRHEGVDIFAARGTPVRAGVDGVIASVSTLRLGGKTVRVVGADAAVHYYAHLDAWAPGIAPGQRVAPDTLLGFVGDTGNAKGTPPHLHYETRPAALLFLPADPMCTLERPKEGRALCSLRRPLASWEQRTRGGG